MGVEGWTSMTSPLMDPVRVGVPSFTSSFEEGSHSGVPVHTFHSPRPSPLKVMDG